jgi:hypothetical protein
MERTASAPVEGLGHWAWSLLLLGLLAWQGWMTLSLFGDNPWEALLDDRPILSGSHPLHLYHGYLGAKALRATGRSSCYDPSFQAGYPKTPVFDGGSRPAELFLDLAGGDYQPGAYKIGLALLCLAAPLLLALAARAAGLGRAGAFWTTAAGLAVWWGDPGRLALEAGDVALLLAGLAVLAHVGLLLRYDAKPGPASWLGLMFTAGLGWLAHPLLFALVLPLLLIYYLSVGTRHGQLSWHIALWGSEAGGLAFNVYWLADWVRHWWIRSPLPRAEGLLSHRTLRSFWEASLWGDPADRAVAVLLVASGVVGVVLFNLARRRAAARLFGLGSAALVVLALLGISWEPLGRVGTSGLLVPGLWLATVPAAHAWVAGCRRLARPLGGVARAAWLCATVALVAVLALGGDVVTLAERLAGAKPFQIGLGPEREALIETLIRCTGQKARILWEDRPGPRTAPRWTALLSLLTGRTFLGGLDPDGCIEHSHAGLIKQKLDGKPIGDWKEDDLADFCRRYNVGWVAAWSPAVVGRFRAWKGAKEVARLHDGEEGYLFEVVGHVPTYALKGKAELIEADSRHITLANVAPEEGQVVLSLHYQAGLRAAPSRVQVDRDREYSTGTLDFIRLRVASPVARVTLTWDEW